MLPRAASFAGKTYQLAANMFEHLEVLGHPEALENKVLMASIHKGPRQVDREEAFDQHGRSS